MKKVLFCLLVIVCIAISWSCQNTKRYKIPKTNKVLLIYRPWFTGAAYVTVRDSGATTLKKSDVDVMYLTCLTPTRYIMSTLGI